MIFQDWLCGKARGRVGIGHSGWHVGVCLAEVGGGGGLRRSWRVQIAVIFLLSLAVLRAAVVVQRQPSARRGCCSYVDRMLTPNWATETENWHTN